MTKVTDVTVAVFIRPDGSFLLSSRPEGKPYAGYWEFPGGKIEPGETVKAALTRELIEELNVVIDDASPWFTFMMHYEHATVRLHIWRVTRWHDVDAGLPNASGMRGMEGQQFQWQTIDAITVTPTLPGCVPIFRALTLPTTYVLTNAGGVGAETYLQQIRAVWGKNASKRPPDGEVGYSPRSIDSTVTLNDSTLSPTPPPSRGRGSSSLSPRGRGIEGEGVEQGMPPIEQRWANKLIQIREKNLSDVARGGFAQQLAFLAHQQGAIVLVNSDIELAKSIGADGVHLTSAQLAAINERPAFNWVGASVHNEAELTRAAELKCDFAVLGSVKNTESHPGQTPIGWKRFAEIVQDAPIPVFAIGGLSRGDLAEAQRHGAHGIAMQRAALSG